MVSVVGKPSSQRRAAESQDKASTSPSYLVGPSEPPLSELTLGQLLKKQTEVRPSRPCLVFSEANYRATYGELYERTLKVAKGLLAAGVQNGDRIGIFAGNVPAYVELFFAASHVGAALVVFNTTYTPLELKSALKHSGCKILFAATTIGKLSTLGILDMLSNKASVSDLPEFSEVILLKASTAHEFRIYDQFIQKGSPISTAALSKASSSVSTHDICNLQFTSGTTGSPKAAMLTHRNVVNDGQFVGDRMRLTEKDVICCPPPMFHCFGLVLGVLAVLSHGASIVFPSETFDPGAVIKSLTDERCTGLHGVPAMLTTVMKLLRPGMEFPNLRTGIAAGAPVSKQMMEELNEKLHMPETTITYGMTETSPGSFMSFTDDPLEKRLTTVGTILPHTQAKIVDLEGNILPRGERGELLVAGFSLQKGYWRNPEKTAEAMVTDSDGILWMKTGDEAIFDLEGYCRITGRIKDIIIRGGENIFPLEIEERLAQHPSVIQSSVIGISDEKYGEVVGAFLEGRTWQRPSRAELREYVRQTLGWHKAPVHIFWLMEGESFPKTGSGKVQKHILKAKAQALLRNLGKEKKVRSKL